MNETSPAEQYKKQDEISGFIRGYLEDKSEESALVENFGKVFAGFDTALAESISRSFIDNNLDLDETNIFLIQLLVDAVLDIMAGKEPSNVEELKVYKDAFLQTVQMLNNAYGDLLMSNNETFGQKFDQFFSQHNF